MLKVRAGWRAHFFRLGAAVFIVSSLLYLSGCFWMLAGGAAVGGYEVGKNSKTSKTSK